MIRKPILLLLQVLLPAAIGLLPARAEAQSACPWLSQKPSDTNQTFAFSGFSFGTATAAHFNQGYVQITASVTVSSAPSGTNTLCIRTASASLGTNGDGAKPLTDLLWSADGSTWYPITGSFAEIPGIRWSGSSSTITLQFRMTLDWAADIPNTYFADLQFRTGRI